MIRGCRAAAIRSAARSIAAGSGRAADGCALRRRGGGRRVFPRRRQRLARQAQVDRSARRRGGDGERAIDYQLDLVAEHQLVLPLHVLAHQRALIAHLLSPVDGQVTAAAMSRLGERRAARGEEQRHTRARRVHHAHQRVGDADVDVDHHRLRPSGGHPVAVRHADRDHLVRHRDRARRGESAALGARQRLDQRREVGAGVGEEEVDAALRERREIRLRHGGQSD